MNRKPTGILFFPAFDWAISPTHPEREERLLYTRDQLFEEGIMDMPQVKEYNPKLAAERDIARVHFCVPDVASQITEAHLISSGSTLVIADAFMNGEIHNGFAIVRPPGHHAMTVSHGNRGFCNINNEAIMIEYLRQKYKIKRMAIVDTDVHHGDGTQDIYWHDSDVLFISFHQDGRTIFPGTGFTRELGGPLAYGTTINIPLPLRTTDTGIHYIMDNLVQPLLDEFKPDLIINSAGQDNHYSDPLADMRFSAQGYARLNQKLAPDIAVLEGGYSVETALPYINMGIIMAMAGIDYSNLREPDYRPDRFSESSAGLAEIKKMVNSQLHTFRNREETIMHNRKKNMEFETFHKNIFYDTEYISEDQVERLRLCPKCGGFRVIHSSAQHRNAKYYEVFCIAVAVNNCEQCHREALEMYSQMKNKSSFDYIYLQDRIADQFKCLDLSKDMETVL